MADRSAKQPATKKDVARATQQSARPEMASHEADSPVLEAPLIGAIKNPVEHLTPNAVRRLQQTHGNQFVLRLMSRREVPSGPSVRSRVQRVDPDFEITGKSTQGDKIYFAENNDSLDTDEKIKILLLADPPDRELTLKGFASEDEPATLADKRLAAVDAELASNGHTAKRTLVPSAKAALGRMDYRQMRSVEIIPAGVKSTTPDCSKAPKFGPCNPAFETALKDARARADSLIDAVIAEVSGAPSPATQGLLDQYFGGGVSGEGIKVKDKVAANLKLLKAQIGRLMQASAHRCANECDATCRSAIAYNTDVGSAARLTICLGYTGMTLDERARNLVHEASHATDGLGHPGVKGEGTDDVAYRHERLIDLLPPAEALRNADSYALFVMRAGDPSYKAQRPPSDDLTSITDPTELMAVKQGIARLQKWLTFAQQESSSVYAEINTSIKDGKWSNSYYEDTMKLMAGPFGLTAPPALPTNDDQMKVAGIQDRYLHLRNDIKFALTFTRDKAGSATTWQTGPGKEVNVCDDLFSASDDDKRARLLADKLVHAAAYIPPGYEAAYAQFADDVRKKH